MKNKEIISTLLICSFLVCSCNKPIHDLTKNEITKFHQKAPDQTQDVSSNISGTWSWKAIKEDKKIGEGFIILKEETGGKIAGVNRVPIVVQNGAETGVVIRDIPVSGKRSGREVSLSLKTFDNKEIKSVVTLSNKGHIMQGTSKEPVPLPKDPKHIMEYNWIAVKIK